MILIGSRALKYWYPDSPLREDADWDVIAPRSYEPKNGARMEVHDQNHLNNWDIHALIHELYDWNLYTDSIQLPNGDVAFVAPLEVLAAIKRSHLWRDYQWDKHITHYNKYLRQHLTEDVQDFLKERTRLTKEAYPQGNPSLNQSNEEFFDDAVAKVYDHDFIHELAAYYDAPLYTRLKRDDSKAWCEKDLWEALSLEDKRKCVAEECYVIATERYLVRNNWNYRYSVWGKYVNSDNVITQRNQDDFVKYDGKSKMTTNTNKLYTWKHTYTTLDAALIESPDLYGHYLATNSQGEWVMEVKGSGQIMAVAKDKVQEVLPYTIGVRFNNNGTTYHYLAEKDKFPVGFYLVESYAHDNFQIAQVTAVDTKSPKATKEFTPFGKLAVDLY